MIQTILLTITIIGMIVVPRIFVDPNTPNPNTYFDTRTLQSIDESKDKLNTIFDQLNDLRENKT